MLLLRKCRRSYGHTQSCGGPITCCWTLRMKSTCYLFRGLACIFYFWGLTNFCFLACGLLDSLALWNTTGCGPSCVSVITLLTRSFSSCFHDSMYVMDHHPSAIVGLDVRNRIYPPVRAYRRTAVQEGTTTTITRARRSGGRVNFFVGQLLAFYLLSKKSVTRGSLIARQQSIFPQKLHGFVQIGFCPLRN